MDWPRCSPSCPEMMKNIPRIVVCPRGVLISLSSSESFSAITAVRSCAKESFNDLNYFRLVRHVSHHGLGVHTRWHRGAQHFRDVVIHRHHMQVHFTDGAHALRRTPAIFLCWNCIRQPFESLFEIRNFVQEFHPRTGRRSGWRQIRKMFSGLLLRLNVAVEQYQERAEKERGSSIAHPPWAAIIL